MNNKEANKKDWAKNAIIVFLVIMLLLTLFSNTITNYTLPQVSVAQVTPGTVSLSIRGSGTVESADSYSVKASESRTILAVNVAKGDHVEFGDSIFELQDADSPELTKARDELATLELTYYKSLLTTKMSASAARSVNSNGASSFNSYIAKIDELEQKIADAEDLIKEKQQIVDNLKVGKSVEAVRQLSTDLEKTLANTALTDAQEAFNTAKNKYIAYLNNRKSELSNEKTKLSSTASLGRIQTALVAINDGLGGATTTGIASTDINTHTFLILENDYKTLYEFAKDKSEYQTLISEANQAISAYNSSLGNDYEINDLNERMQKIDNELVEANNLSYKDAESYKEALGRYNAAIMSEYNNKKTNANYDAASEYASEDLTKAQNELKELQDEMTSLVNDISNSLDADKTSDDIVRKKEEIAKLEAKAMGAAITAPVSGTIQSMSKTAGEQIKPEDELCVIIPDGKDMLISISVTNDNAKKINIGDTATLANSWAYPDAVCVVKSISDDPADPANKSIVKFTITGDGVKLGQNMNLTLEADTKNYDKIVPNAAIKHDNSGDFIYVIQEKSSPLGNRYYAKKVTINKLAQDDTKTAISGDVNSYSSVITGANKTPEAGKQVRLSESSAN